MITIEDLARGRTLAEEQGMTEELGRALAKVASDELVAGRIDSARLLLEGLAVTNPHDHAAWAMLALVERRRGRLLAARVCAEVAHRLAPADEQVRLARAEVMLLYTDERSQATAELTQLRSARGDVGGRAKALLTALGV